MELRSCKHCGNIFKVSLSEAKLGKGIFCSKRCYDAAKRPRKNVVCVECGKDFSVKLSRFKNGRGIFCSIKCKGINLSKKIGDKSLHWKGGIKRENIRGCGRYKRWRLQVFEKDNFSCQKCGATKNLRAHHIRKFSFIMNDLRQKFPSLRLIESSKNMPKVWDVENGITLCERCHRKEHSKEKVCL